MCYHYPRIEVERVTQWQNKFVHGNIVNEKDRIETQVLTKKTHALNHYNNVSQSIFYRPQTSKLHWVTI